MDRREHASALRPDTFTRSFPGLVVAVGTPAPSHRVAVDGKFFRLGRQRWFVKGFTYGPFAPDRDGHHLPDRAHMRADFAQIRDLGANALRLYHPPPRRLLDDAAEHDLRVLIDVPW